MYELVEEEEDPEVSSSLELQVDKKMAKKIVVDYLQLIRIVNAIQHGRMAKRI
jgi:hypothetical protein